MWNYSYRESFLRDLSKVQPKKTRERIEEIVFQYIPGMENPFSYKGLTAMQGYHGFYKIRMRNFRIGVSKAKNLDNRVLQDIAEKRYIFYIEHILTKRNLIYLTYVVISSRSSGVIRESIIWTNKVERRNSYLSTLIFLLTDVREFSLRHLGKLYIVEYE